MPEPKNLHAAGSRLLIGKEQQRTIGIKIADLRKNPDEYRRLSH